MEFLEQQELRIVRDTAKALRISMSDEHSAADIRAEIFARYPVVDEPLSDYLEAKADQYRRDDRISALQAQGKERKLNEIEGIELEKLVAGRESGDIVADETRTAWKNALAASGVVTQGER